MENYQTKFEELQGGVKEYSVDIDLENGENVRDLTFKSLEKAKKIYLKYLSSMEYEGEVIEDIQLIKVFKNENFLHVNINE